MSFSITMGDLLLIIGMLGGFVSAIVKIVNNQNTNHTELHTALIEIKYQISLIQSTIDRLEQDTQTNNEDIIVLKEIISVLEQRLSKIEGVVYGE